MFQLYCRILIVQTRVFSLDSRNEPSARAPPRVRVFVRRVCWRRPKTGRTPGVVLSVFPPRPAVVLSVFRPREHRGSGVTAAAAAASVFEPTEVGGGRASSSRWYTHAAAGPDFVVGERTPRLRPGSRLRRAAVREVLGGGLARGRARSAVVGDGIPNGGPTGPSAKRAAVKLKHDTASKSTTRFSSGDRREGTDTGSCYDVDLSESVFFFPSSTAKRFFIIFFSSFLSKLPNRRYHSLDQSGSHYRLPSICRGVVGIGAVKREEKKKKIENRSTPRTKMFECLLLL